MAKYNEKFTQWLITGGVESNLVKMINIFNSLDDNEGLWYAIVCLKHLIRIVNNSKLGLKDNTNINYNNITFPFEPLTNIT